MPWRGQDPRHFGDGHRVSRARNLGVPQECRTRGGILAPFLEAPEIVEIPPSPEVDVTPDQGGVSVPPAPATVPKSCLMGPEVAGPSSSAVAPPLGVARGLAPLPPDALVTRDVRLAERVPGSVGEGRRHLRQYHRWGLLPVAYGKCLSFFPSLFFSYF